MMARLRTIALYMGRPSRYSRRTAEEQLLCSFADGLAERKTRASFLGRAEQNEVRGIDIDFPQQIQI